MGCGASHHELQRLHHPDAKVSLRQIYDTDKKDKVYTLTALNFIFPH